MELGWGLDNRGVDAQSRGEWCGVKTPLDLHEGKDADNGKGKCQLRH